jgi:maltose alpha-D-glucosyltransferase/alpha-amylase
MLLGDTDADTVPPFRLLGVRTGELHQALAAPTDDPAFAAEPIAADDLERWRRAVRRQAEAAFRALEQALPRLEEAQRAQIQALLASREACFARIEALTGAPVAAAKTRVHGDYHLGQVLVAQNDFYILDFEGEPARPLAERRAKSSPLKDVAGMLRSFGYAAHAGLFAYTAARPDAFDHFARWAEIWETWTSAAFLRGYFKAIEHALFVPVNPAQRDELLCLFVLEKALYELNYEINHRPEWLRIPVFGIRRLLG